MSDVKRILIIDDNPDELTFYCKLLSRCVSRYEISTAKSAVEGLGLFKQKRFDCTFIDYNMPEMDGMQLLKEMKAPVAGEIAVVMLTGDRHRETRAQAARDGAMDFIVKDAHMSPEQFEAVINKVIKWAKVLNESAA